MKLIKNSNENEMILEFLKGELNSSRFNEKLNEVLGNLNLDLTLITNGDTSNNAEKLCQDQIKKRRLIWKNGNLE